MTEIEVKNFKTLRDVRIPLAPGITVLVGANNSGKSNALAVLKLLAETERKDASTALSALGGWNSLCTRGAAGPLTVQVAAQFEGKSHYFGFRATAGKYEPSVSGWRRPPAPDSGVVRPASEQATEWLRGTWRATTVHDLSVAALREPALVQQGAVLEPDGRGIAAVLDNLAGEAPSLRDSVDAMVCSAAHEVRRVVTRPGPEPGTKVLGVEERDGLIYGADEMSDGLLLFIGLAVAAQMKASQPGILAIEEPERGIHPRRIRELMDHLLKLTKSGVQVVLTTHSPTLLDEFRDTPESVLIFDRDEQGTHVTRLSDRPEWVEQLQGVALGDLWYSGVLGGVPGR